MMAVSLTFSPQLKASRPRELVSADMADGIHTKAATADGTRLLLVLNTPDTDDTPYVPRLTVVTDWQARLRR